MERLSPLRALLGGFTLCLIVFAAFFPLLGNELLWPAADQVARGHATAAASSSQAEGAPWVRGSEVLAAQLQSLENRLAEPSARLHRILSCLLHAANAVLLWFVLRALGLRTAFFVAALFAAHPIVLQPILWSGYREVFIGLFAFLLSLRFALAAQNSFARLFALLGAAFAMAIHPVALTIPAVLFFQRLRTVRIPKLANFNAVLPYACIALVMGLIISDRHSLREDTAFTPIPEITESEENARPALVGNPAPQGIELAGRQMGFALTRIAIPLDNRIFYPFAVTAESLETGRLSFLTPFLLFVPLGFLAFFHIRRRWGRSLLAALGLFLILSLFCITQVGREPSGLPAQEDYLLYFLAPAFLVLLAGILNQVLSKIEKKGNALRRLLAGLLVLLSVGVSAASSQQFKDESAVWLHIIEQFPESWAARLGYVQTQLDLPEAALSDEELEENLLEILAARPQLVSVRQTLTELYLETNQMDRAERELRRLLRDSPQNLTFLQQFAELNTRLGRTWEVLTTHERIIEIAPDSLPSLRTLADIHMNNRRFLSAIPYLQRLNALEADSFESRLDLATAYTATGRPAEAREILNQLVSSEGTRPEVDIRLAYLSLEAEPAAARNQLLELAEQSFGDPALHEMLARYFATAGYFEPADGARALRHARLSVANSERPGAEYLHTLGLAEAAADEVQQGVRTLRRALALAAQGRDSGRQRLIEAHLATVLEDGRVETLF